MSALKDASEALLVLRAALRRDPVPSPLPCAAEALAALERIIESGTSRVSLTILAHGLRRGDVELVDVEDAIDALGEVALQEALAAPTKVISDAYYPRPTDTVAWNCMAGRHGTCRGWSIEVGACGCDCHGLATDPAASRPASPPPPSGRGDDLAVELSAAYAATGDTLPPASGELELGEMACCAGSDTDRAAPGDGWLWGEIPPVEI
ncbi:hypothetical protein [Sorangium sp. So ce1024]|uniref:hypothetical protein n=1 Tax=Sorangium sp. So ce1024 TaxID=3133327 RepID=UPI003F127BCC